jgi:hypothetical protein
MAELCAIAGLENSEAKGDQYPPLSLPVQDRKYFSDDEVQCIYAGW